MGLVGVGLVVGVRGAGVDLEAVDPAIGGELEVDAGERKAEVGGEVEAALGDQRREGRLVVGPCRGHCWLATTRATMRTVADPNLLAGTATIGPRQSGTDQSPHRVASSVDALKVGGEVRVDSPRRRAMAPKLVRIVAAVSLVAAGLAVASRSRPGRRAQAEAAN
jgi:hypothetical protein